MKKIQLAWAISLIVCGLTAILLVLRTAGLGMPDGLVRAMGALDLVALPVLAYATVRLIKGSHEEEKA